MASRRNDGWLRGCHDKRGDPSMSHRRLHRFLLPVILILCLFSATDFGGSLTDSLPASGGGDPRLALLPAVATLAAVGDTIMHTPVLAAAWDPVTRTYDFRPMFQEMQPLMSQADLTMAVLETNLAGPATGYTGYPSFNTPDQIADALAWAGVDILFTAHNHMLDRGLPGIFRTVGYLDRLGLGHVGSAKTADPAARIAWKDVHGIRFAFLSYTTATNGLTVPASSLWAANLYTPQAMVADVAKARENGAEIIVCALHSGTEYLRKPDQQQLTVTREMADAGVDIILGSHPHVIQPITYLKGPRGEAFAAYSLGNLISNQRWRYSDCGLMLFIVAAREPGGTARVARVSWLPFWVHRYAKDGMPRFRVLPIDDARLAIYARDNLLSEADRQRLREVWQETKELIGYGSGE